MEPVANIRSHAPYRTLEAPHSARRGVSRRQLAYVLRRLERSAFVIRQVTASAPDRTTSETTERLLCKLGLQSRALSGCNPDAPLQFTFDITSRYHSGWTARVADAHDDTVRLLSGTVYL